MHATNAKKVLSKIEFETGPSGSSLWTLFETISSAQKRANEGQVKISHRIVESKIVLTYMPRWQAKDWPLTSCFLYLHHSHIALRCRRPPNTYAHMRCDHNCSHRSRDTRVMWCMRHLIQRNRQTWVGVRSSHEIQILWILKVFQRSIATISCAYPAQL